MKVAEINARGISISRVEEVCGWLGRQQADPSERGFDRWPDDPPAAESDDLERRAA